MNIICRCQDVTEEEIVAAIRQGATTIDEIKRLVRAGMGPCQGRTCRRLVSQIISRELQIPMKDVYPPTFRPPNRPVPFKLVMAELERHDQEEAKQAASSSKRNKQAAKGAGKKPKAGKSKGGAGK